MTESSIMEATPGRTTGGGVGLLAGLAPLVVYAAVVIPLGWQQRERMNPDAICYIQRARYLVQGDFYHSISDNWSPLISWCIAPLLAAGMDGLYAARAVVCIWGGALLVSLGFFLRAFTRLSEIGRLAVLVVLAVGIAPMCVRGITPDVLLAACLFTYFSLVVHPRMGRSRWWALLAGLVGGVAYLAKAYALPFVMVHAPLSLALRAYSRRRERDGADSESLRGTAMACLLVMGGVLMVALPWAGALTWRYGHFTFTGVGARAHALMLSADPRERNATYFGAPPGPYLVRSETQELIPYTYWSPLDSVAHFKRQLAVIGDHAARIGWTIWLLDPLHCAAIAIVVAGLLLACGRAGWETVWLLGSGAVYCSGFLPVYITERYLLPMLVPLCLILCLKVIWETGRGASEEGRAGGWSAVRVGLSLVVLGSFTISGMGEINALRRQVSSDFYRCVGRGIQERGLAGPIASPSRTDGSYAAYFTGQKYIGFPAGKDLDEVERQLLMHRPIVLIGRYPKPDRQSAETMRVAMALVQRPSWRLAFEYGTARSGVMAVYVPVEREPRGE